MNMIRLALRKPITVMVAVLAIAYFSFTAIKKINVDIFPEIESPAIYIALPYGGLTPAYMDGFMANEFQKLLIFVSGVKDIDFKSIQGFTLMKLTFYPGTNMAQSSAELSAQVSRAMALLPPGAIPPQVVRFDASSQPVGQLVFESPKRTITELQTLALTKIRPMFVNIPGVTAPAPFGGNVRTIVVKVDPGLMQSYGLSAEEVTTAIAKNSFPSPAGNIRIGDKNLMSPVNTMAKGPEEFLNMPLRTGSGTTVFVKDIGTVEDAADITTGYAVINGKRSVYLPVIKKADASTLTVVDNLKKSIPMLEGALPEDVKVNYVFDQSGYISRALNNLVHEGILGAVLTGLMVLLFLGDKRGALIVVLTIPIAILSAVIMLYIMGQTINIMTLSGLALAIGILVDEATVTIENIHQHFEMEKPKDRAILDALLEISIPKLLILLCILAVLVPSFMMTGIPKDMFLPLSLAVAFAMIASFIASQTFVPILANWLMKTDNFHHHQTSFHKKKLTRFEKFKRSYLLLTRKAANNKKKVVALYALLVVVMIGLAALLIGTDILPASNSGDIQLRIAAPQGTRLEKAEKYLKDVTLLIRKQLPDNAVKIGSAYVGLQPSTTAINPIFLFTSGSHESVLQLSIDQEVYSESIEELKENIRKAVNSKYPELQLTFEPMEMVQKIMSQGANTPIQIKVAAGPLKTAVKHAGKISEELKKTPFFRDVRVVEPVQYPSVQIDVDRELVAQFGLSMQEVSKALTIATSSTRFTNKNLWVDPKSGLVFQVQLQIPEAELQSLENLRSLPLKSGSTRPVLEDVATLRLTKQPGQVNRQGPNRYVTVQANTYNKDLGSASKAVEQALMNVGEAPRGVIVKTEGTLQLLRETMDGLQTGLVVAVVVIFLLLTAYYQSFAVSALILSVVPAVLGGSLLILLAAGSTLNLQSYMGIIMSVGVSVSNAVLLVNQAELNRKRGMEASLSAFLAVSSRLRPIVMTTLAMIAGMIPMALGMGDGGEQIAPLGQAVIGGLILSTVTSLLVLPHLFVMVRGKATLTSNSLDPDDPERIILTKIPVKIISKKEVYEI
ncbi:acriflavin resistance protein [Pelobium manganitolerans]|uniref:Acriflavin resistance protein n=1 Tax=Pelobium manganitolerans TaxID=1842495 RepID=A0A419S4Z8_9SPHI|nr:efflux RND transporter permease subunit [Pelobium manganitolerans]RKD15192.1 acriflavin resistance protein [Pelobium manganitolerans]